MPRAPRVCSKAGCPTLTDTGHCIEHRRQADHARGTRQQRGYDAAHDRLRREHAPTVQAGRAQCWRCGLPIAPGDGWHLGHDDADRRIHRGPEHALCNLSAAGRAAHPE